MQRDMGGFGYQTKEEKKATRKLKLKEQEDKKLLIKSKGWKKEWAREPGLHGSLYFR